MMYRRPRAWLALAGLFGAAVSLAAAAAQQPRVRDEGQRPVFKTGVDLVHVTVTVTDGSGHFVRGLRREDFQLTEDGQPQRILQFTAERAPVSLGIALDTSSSMAGAKIREAREALRRVVEELLEPDDEVFLYTFSDAPVLRHAWTTEREVIRRALEAAAPDGRTALYDAVDAAMALMESGRYRKKVLLVVSDGNDTASFTPVTKLRSRISDSETLVYAIGIDSNEQRLRDGLWRVPRTGPRWQVRRPPPPRFPAPRPPVGIPPGSGGGTRPPWDPPPPPNSQPPLGPGDTANIQALRELTDISGGRTEVVRSSSDLGPATASVADELSRQYQLVYQSSTRRDGRWHAIEVTVREGYQVRARRGYMAATP